MTESIMAPVGFFFFFFFFPLSALLFPGADRRCVALWGGGQWGAVGGKLLERGWNNNNIIYIPFRLAGGKARARLIQRAHGTT